MPLILRRSRLAVAAVALLVSACFLPPIKYTGYVTGADLDGKTRPEVIAQLGLPSAVSPTGDLLYAIPSAGYHYNGEQLVYRIVRFDARGVVVQATPPKQTTLSLASLCDRL